MDAKSFPPTFTAFAIKLQKLELGSDFFKATAFRLVIIWIKSDYSLLLKTASMSQSINIYELRFNIDSAQAVNYRSGFSAQLWKILR